MRREVGYRDATYLRKNYEPVTPSPTIEVYQLLKKIYMIDIHIYILYKERGKSYIGIFYEK